MPSHWLSRTVQMEQIREHCVRQGPVREEKMETVVQKVNYCEESSLAGSL
jgi:hypothetical protein